MSYLSGRILVTGATGFLGGKVAQSLVKAGIEVIAQGRDVDKLDELEEQGIAIYRRDFSTPISVNEAKGLGQLTAIVHCAGLSSPWGRLEDFRAANTMATKHVVDLAKSQLDCRLIYISSPAIYFAPKDQKGVKESSALPQPVNHYARTKIEAENVVRASEVNSVILRPRGIYGPGDTALLPRLLETAQQRALPLLRDGIAATDLTHVDDVVRAVEAALRAEIKRPGKAFNISGGEEINIKSLIDAIGHYAGTPISWRPTSIGAATFGAKTLEFMGNIGLRNSEPPITSYTLGLLAYTQTLDITAAEKVLDWTPEISFTDGLNQTLEAVFS